MGTETTTSGPERVTGKQMCELISRWLKATQGVGLAWEEIWNYSPTGELYWVFVGYELARMWEKPLPEPEREERMTDEKPKLKGLVQDDAKTLEGKYLVKRRDGTVVEWPSFVLGARDPHSPAALRAYADSISSDPDAHPEYPARLRKLASEFEEYRARNGNGDPTRGVHRKDDPATIEEMRAGHSA